MSDPIKDVPAVGSPNFEARLREELQRFMGNRGDSMDRAVRVRDLAALGVVDVPAGGDTKTLAPGPAISPLIPVEKTGEDLTPPPTPTGFKLDAAMVNVFVTHDPPVYPQGRGHDRTVLYGLRINPGDPLPTFADAAKLSDFKGEVYAYPSDPATTWRMWIKWRTLDGVESVTPAGGINGLEARTGEDVALLLEMLTGQITESQLNKELSKVIEGTSDSIAYLATQWGLKVQVASDGKKLVGGYALMGSNEEGRGPSIDFGVLANRFYIGAPAENGGISSTQPFIVQTTPTVINGVNVPVGVYMADAYIKNGTITNVKIANAAIDDAKIAFLSANKIRAGSISLGEYIQSSTYSANGAQGWRIDGSGNAEFRQVVVRGGVFATYGQISGIIIDANGLRTSNYAQGPGFYLGNDGKFSLGSALTWDGATLNIKGKLNAASGTFTGELQAATGTFKGALTAATGTFSGTLTANAINAVSTLNIAGGAVTSMRLGEGGGETYASEGRPCFCYLDMGDSVLPGSAVVVSGTVSLVQSATGNWVGARIELRANSRVLAYTYVSLIRHQNSTATVVAIDDSPLPNWNTYEVFVRSDPAYPGPISVARATITATGGKR